MVQTRPVSVLMSSMQDGQTSVVGMLTDEDMGTVLDACRKSKLFTIKEKKRFFY